MIGDLGVRVGGRPRRALTSRAPAWHVCRRRCLCYPLVMKQLPDRAEATAYLRDSTAGDTAAGERLLALVYSELRRKAAAFLAQETPGHTLQPTALVHEAWFRLIEQDRVEWKNEGHFMAVAAGAMRRILVDHARRKHASRRGGDRVRVELNADVTPPAESGPDVEAIDAGLDKLREKSPRLAQIVELRFFAGLPMEQIGRILGLSKSTLDREWRVARAWLQGLIKREQETE